MPAHEDDDDDDGDYDDDVGNDCDKECLPVALVALWILHSWSVRSLLYITFASIGTNSN